MKAKVVIPVLVLTLLIPENLFAHGINSARSVGMGGAYTVVAKGAESAFWNPANLGLSSGPKRSWMIFSLALNAHNNSFSLQQYNRYNGKFLTADDKQSILNSIPAEGLNLSLDGDFLALGISDGRFGFTISGKGASDLMLPKDPIEVLFFGNEINDTILLSDSQGEAFASLDIGFCHGRSVWKKDDKQLLCGVNLRYSHGLMYRRVAQAEGEVFTLETGVNGNGDFLVQSAGGGGGYGLDFGFTLEYKENWWFGLSFINLISHMKWSKNTEEKVYRVRVDSLVAEHFDPDSVIIDESYTRKIGPFTSRIPTVMHLGLAYQVKSTLFSFDLKQGFKKRMGISSKPRASLGAEYNFLSWLDIRGGIAIGGDEGVTLANGLGFKLGAYHLDFGIAVHRGLWPTRSKGVSLAISNGLSF